jgi:hypothetical protein
METSLLIERPLDNTGRHSVFIDWQLNIEAELMPKRRSRRLRGQDIAKSCHTSPELIRPL